MNRELLIGIIVVIAIAVVFVIYKKLHKSFKFPYKTIDIDVTGKSQPNAFNVIDEWLCNKKNRDLMDKSHKKITDWKVKQSAKIKSKTQWSQFQAAIDENEFHFNLYHTVVKTKKKDGKKYKTVIKKTVATQELSYDYLQSRCQKLREEYPAEYYYGEKKRK